ncbi:hypothetical protein [Streptomyces sp. NPDC018045]|uniref:hypothetical protein n=1 Tax=Streptomyces sp. NPDC018045 TaxID=3365037 RepID=UPI00378D54A9
MEDALNIMEVATGGAAVLVAEMAKSGWASFRAGVARFFGRGGEERAQQELSLVDAAHARLTESPEGERDAVSEALRQQLFIQLAAFLQHHPEAAADLQALVDGADSAEEGHRVQANVQHNTNSQVVISGGSLSANNITYRTTGDDK